MRIQCAACIMAALGICTVVMSLNPLTAVSAVDGRYAGKTVELRETLSESALIRERIAVELTWLKALASDDAVEELKPFSAAQLHSLDGILKDFSVDDAAADSAHTCAALLDVGDHSSRLRPTHHCDTDHFLENL